MTRPGWKRATLALSIVCAGGLGARASSPAQVPEHPRAVEIERTLAQALLEEPWGSGQLADLAWPPGFLGRVADRELRALWREREHRVVDDPPRPIPVAPWAVGYGLLALLIAWLAARRSA